MNDARPDLDSLEQYLRDVDVLESLAHSFGGGGHPSYLAILRGGVGVLVKPETAAATGPVMVRREAAAWRLARSLGWHDLIAATVLREIQPPGVDRAVVASVQVLWPSNQPGGPDPSSPESAFLEEDLWRAAIFDALIRSSDRHAGNWLAVPREAGPNPQRLKLIDHGHAFDASRPLSEAVCPFYIRLRSERIPEPWLTDLIDLSRDTSGVQDLLPAADYEAFVDRLNLLSGGDLEINEP